MNSVRQNILLYSSVKNSIKVLGLNDKEAKESLSKNGPNILIKKKILSPFKIFFSQFYDILILLLIGSIFISIFLGEVTEAVTILVVVILNAALGFIQEYRTEKTLEALKKLSAPMSKVIRNGVLTIIQAIHLVPSDVIVLETGDRIPADASLIESNYLCVDESILTGESVPVEKKISSKTNKSTEDKVYMGSLVTNGNGKAIILATGMNTQMGKIANMIQDIEQIQTPLQKRLKSLGRYIAFGCIIICIIVTITGILRGEPLISMLISGICLAVAAIPEGLPTIVTISLAIGVSRMVKHNALIRKLPAVETLGCASIICSDKTGTLTQNKMMVRKIITYDSTYESAKLLLEIGVICNNSSILNTNKLQITGDPTETSLIQAAFDYGIAPQKLIENYQRIAEIPFDSERKCMSVISENKIGEVFVFTKGAPEIILKNCKKVYTSNGLIELDQNTKFKLEKIFVGLASQALRVLGFAYRKTDYYKKSSIKNSYLDNETENGLTFIGFAGLIDPPRKEAINAVLKCKTAGIKPIMITGDHKITATAIAKELNILSENDLILTGNDIDSMLESQESKLINSIKNTSVFARVSPKHKLLIVKYLKKLGNVVAMTGDGVNDAPAIKEADIGIAMGILGTDVTKEAASMILMDDNFATIVSAVEEGRIIYNNIRKFIRYMLACNIGEVLTMFLAMLIGLPIPLLPIQILWVNLVTDGLPAIALGLDPSEENTMLKPPRKINEHIFSDGLAIKIFLRGILICLSTICIFISFLCLSNNLILARTAAFVTLVLTQLIHVFECKSETKTIFEIPIINNIPLVISVAISFIMILGVIYIPLFQEIFKTTPLFFNDWILIIGYSLIGPILASFLKKNEDKLTAKTR